MSLCFDLYWAKDFTEFSERQLPDYNHQFDSNKIFHFLLDWLINFSSAVLSTASPFSLCLSVRTCIVNMPTHLCFTLQLCVHILLILLLWRVLQTQGSMTWFYQGSNPNISDHTEHQNLRPPFFFFFFIYFLDIEWLLSFCFIFFINNNNKNMRHCITLAYVINIIGLPWWR